jgi:hypothetical protein
LENGGHRDFVDRTDFKDRTDEGDLVDCTDEDDRTGVLPALLGLYSTDGLGRLGDDKPGDDLPHFKGEAVSLRLPLEGAISKPLREKSLSFPDLVWTAPDVLSSVALHAKSYSCEGVLLSNDAVLRFDDGVLLSAVDGTSDVAIFLRSTSIRLINSSNLINLSLGPLIVIPSSRPQTSSSPTLSVSSRASRHECDITAESYDLRLLIVLSVSPIPLRHIFVAILARRLL